MKCCMSTDVGTWTNWVTFEPDPDHSPDPGTGFFPPISYSLAYFFYISANLTYFSAISVSICAKLARSILMRDRNTATEPNFRKSLSKCRILSPKNTELLISDSPAANAAAASSDHKACTDRPQTSSGLINIHERLSQLELRFRVADFSLRVRKYFSQLISK